MKVKQCSQIINENPKHDDESISAYCRRLAADFPEYKFNGYRKSYYQSPKVMRLDVNVKQHKIRSNKKLQDFNWRKVVKVIGQVKDVKKSASYSQNFAKIEIDTDEPICIINLADTHIGASGTDYDLFEKLTDEILHTKNLYVILNGDILETAINMRGVKEVVSQVIDPEMQIEFLESWLKEIKHKVLWATWDNHTVMREEKVTGFSVYKRIIGRDNAIIYSNGICHIDLKVGNETYKIVSSHKFNGRSLLNPVHGQQRHMRFESLDREIALSGDSHKVGFSWYYDGGVERLAVNAGTLHTASAYAQRFFSLFTIPKFPCIELYPNKHQFTPYQTVGAWKDAKNM